MAETKREKARVHRNRMENYPERPHSGVTWPSFLQFSNVKASEEIEHGSEEVEHGSEARRGTWWSASFTEDQPERQALTRAARLSAPTPLPSFEVPSGINVWRSLSAGTTLPPDEPAPDWATRVQLLVERLSFKNRLRVLENAITDVSDRLTRIQRQCERTLLTPLCVPISTFAPEPFEVIRNFSVVVRPEEESFVATLFDANISSSGETQEEAVENVKDLILMIFQGFEHEDDRELGPAMIRQKHALMSLIRRK
jgi:predicted RNase H-like HicB family nuclease